MKKRNHAFDLLCGICIIRMVSLHIMQQCGKPNEDWWLEIMQWSYFFMSFFFFKAGYFNKSVTAMPSKAYVLDKAKRLFLPANRKRLDGIFQNGYALYVLHQKKIPLCPTGN